MLQGNKNKLSYRGRVRDNNERKRKVVPYFVFWNAEICVTSSSLPCFSCSFFRWEGCPGTPLCQDEQPTYWRSRWWTKNRLHRPHPVNSTTNMAMSICFQIVYECFHLQEQSWKVARKILQPTKLDLHLWLGHLQKIFVDLPDLISGRRNINWEFLALFYSRFWLSLLWFFLWDFLCHYSERA